MKIDREYSTTWWLECKYLLDHGVKYTFVKEIEQDGNRVTVWKFKKNEELFRHLSDFYGNVYSK